jgi:hypothetical protein
MIIKKLRDWFYRREFFTHNTCACCRNRYLRPQTGDVLLLGYCSDCVKLVRNLDFLQFKYIGSDHWYSINQLYLIECKIKDNIATYEVLHKTLNDKKRLIVSKDDFVSAVLAANNFHQNTLTFGEII